MLRLAGFLPPTFRAHPTSATSKILDLTGAGVLLPSLLVTEGPEGLAGVKVVCAEGQEEAVQYLAKRIREEGWENVEAARMDFKASFLPLFFLASNILEEHTFDFVFLFQTAHSFAAQERQIRQAASLLSPSGTLLFVLLPHFSFDASILSLDPLPSNIDDLIPCTMSITPADLGRFSSIARSAGLATTDAEGEKLDMGFSMQEYRDLDDALGLDMPNSEAPYGECTKGGEEGPPRLEWEARVLVATNM
ncbi:hypothetical protein JCM10213v2_003805 [Rhodosporidiobolus nylandii]